MSSILNFGLPMVSLGADFLQKIAKPGHVTVSGWQMGNQNNGACAQCRVIKVYNTPINPPYDTLK